MQALVKQSPGKPAARQADIALQSPGHELRKDGSP
jgi:hypothetical protein